MRSTLFRLRREKGCIKMALQIDVDELRDKLGIGDDRVYGAIGEFAEPDDLVKAGRKIREMGYTKIDAMSPFPVHGIDDAIGVPSSKLGWMVIFFSLTGTSLALLLQWYAGAAAMNKFLLRFGLSGYPLSIGGKPFFDFSYSVPVDFELTI